jgi:hypothetical protein
MMAVVVGAATSVTLYPEYIDGSVESTFETGGQNTRGGANMKELFSVFGAEVFRPLVTLVVPGALAASSWFVVLVERSANIRHLVAGNHVETALLLLLATLSLGLVIDDIGTRVEVGILDRRLDKETSGRHTKDWQAYLCCVFPPELVGRGYVRTLVLRLKFELGAAIGTVFGALGLAFTQMPCTYFISVFLLAVALVTYLGILEAPATHRVLSRTRSVLLASTTDSQNARQKSSGAQDRSQ